MFQFLQFFFQRISTKPKQKRFFPFHGMSIDKITEVVYRFIFKVRFRLEFSASRATSVQSSDVWCRSSQWPTGGHPGSPGWFSSGAGWWDREDPFSEFGNREKRRRFGYPIPWGVSGTHRQVHRLTIDLKINRFKL